jgi:hypothetical protein
VNTSDGLHISLISKVYYITQLMEFVGTIWEFYSRFNNTALHVTNDIGHQGSRSDGLRRVKEGCKAM